MKYFVLGGFCLLVAIFSKQFITSLSDKIIKQVKEQVQQQTKATVKESVDKAFDEKGQVNERIKEVVNLETANIKSKLSVMDDFVKLESQLKNPNNPKVLALEDFTKLLDDAIQSNDPDLPTQVYDKMSILSYELRQYDLLEKLYGLYKEKIKVTPYSLADLAIANMNNYSASGNVLYKTKAQDYINKALSEMPGYGALYTSRLYLLTIEYGNLPEGDIRKAELLKNMKDIFNEISNMEKGAIKEAYNYFKLNDSTGFLKYNDKIKELLPEEWKVLEQSSEAVVS